MFEPFAKNDWEKQKEQEIREQKARDERLIKRDVWGEVIPTKPSDDDEDVWGENETKSSNPNDLPWTREDEALAAERDKRQNPNELPMMRSDKYISNTDWILAKDNLGFGKNPNKLPMMREDEKMAAERERRKNPNELPMMRPDQYISNNKTDANSEQAAYERIQEFRKEVAYNVADAYFEKKGEFVLGNYSPTGIKINKVLQDIYGMPKSGAFSQEDVNTLLEHLTVNCPVSSSHVNSNYRR